VTCGPRGGMPRKLHVSAYVPPCRHPTNRRQSLCGIHLFFSCREGPRAPPSPESCLSLTLGGASSTSTRLAQACCCNWLPRSFAAASHAMAIKVITSTCTSICTYTAMSHDASIPHARIYTFKLDVPQKKKRTYVTNTHVYACFVHT